MRDCIGMRNVCIVLAPQLHMRVVHRRLFDDDGTEMC